MARLGEHRAHGAFGARGAPATAQPDGDRHQQPARRGRGQCDTGRGEEAGDRRQNGRGTGEQHHRTGDEQDELACGALQDDRAYAPAEVTGVTAVAYGAVHIAQDAAGQRRVQEQRPVVVRDGPAQGQPQTEAAGHQTPPPGAEHRGQQADGEGGEQRGGIDPAQTVQEGIGSQMPHQRQQNAQSREQPEPRRPAGLVHPALLDEGPGSASRSVWCTATVSSPAAHSSSRRRR
ncbi:hypothetical protein HOK021_30980 [Streptomyces hygroscopicus]|nr:hypothetical protein HOK021_30980 [Streptomyces hygroscopicus]